MNSFDQPGPRGIEADDNMIVPYTVLENLVYTSMMRQDNNEYALSEKLLHVKVMAVLVKV